MTTAESATHPPSDAPSAGDDRPHARVWPARVPRTIQPPQTSLWFNLEVSARRYPDKAATVFFDRVMTYPELQRQAERIAAWLAARGVRRGDRVILFLQNCPQFIVAYYGILRANAVVVPVNPMNKADELGHYITDPQARVAIAAADLAPALCAADAALPPEQRLRDLLVLHYRDAMPDDAFDGEAVPPAWREWLATRHPLPTLTHGQVADWAQALACTDPLPPHEVGPDDLAVLPYTSGTTGLPKGCMHPHRTLMHNAVAAAVWTNGTAENIGLLVVPMFHITGMVAGMHTSVYLGATAVIMPRWDRDLAGRLISRWRVTHWTNIPTMVIDLLASPHFNHYDLSSLVFIGGGGAAMPAAVAQRLLDQFGLRYVEGYGLTETAAPSHHNPPDRPQPQCLGVPFIGCDARVVDPDTLQELPPGEAGEIVVSGPMVFDGYWQRPDATAAVFFEHRGRRYFRTGDLGRVDDNGYFFITDRLKRMINASGFKVWPAEVEALMFRHPAIAEACVIGVPDAYRGETVKAVVVLRQAARGTVSEADIIAWCHEHMAAYKAPRLVEFVDALPKSGSGKVMWRLLQEAARTAAPAAA
ncbi:Long-chain-fatty-acid--CoA ligase [Tepidimonas fonticaldi]|uniref:Long-chain-fatty-acid--CoA ligase n=1 Tax=Tepidimonas fonticaldi TaxID=1101373 RepID=A0A554XPX0_9BURK|nr:long-chain fatty acid--CoA ligase [Tepidimonas fonticaldi]TSE37879.1 Long-chain-fatty-acid--CoA ligase [Tepidimonas fonticaldi]